MRGKSGLFWGCVSACFVGLVVGVMSISGIFATKATTKDIQIKTENSLIDVVVNTGVGNGNITTTFSVKSGTPISANNNVLKIGDSIINCPTQTPQSSQGVSYQFNSWGYTTGVQTQLTKISASPIAITSNMNISASFLIPGLYTDSEYLNMAKITIDSNEVDATWENIVLAYPSAFATQNTIVGDETNTISYMPDLDGYLAIPDTITKIGENSFRETTNLKGVIIPNSVTSISSSSFYRTAISSIEIPYGITKINSFTFAYCSNLVSVTIPSTVTNIVRSAFRECTNLTSIELPPNLTTLGDYVFYKCTSLTGHITIPSSVTTINQYTFNSCSGITSITLPENLTSIGKSSFSLCTGLTSVTIPNKVTSLGDYAFNKCSGLTSVSIPSSVTSIGNYAFFTCGGLTSISIPDSVTSIGERAFYNCNKVESITIPESVTSLGKSSFYYCTKLKTAIVDSSTVASQLTGNKESDAGGILYKATKIYLKTGLSATEFITANFNAITSDMTGYEEYTAKTYKKARTIKNVLTNCTSSNWAIKVESGTTYTTTYTANTGYSLPASITITVTDVELASTDYSYSASTGELTIPGAKVKGTIIITVTAVEDTAT